MSNRSRARAGQMVASLLSTSCLVVSPLERRSTASLDAGGGAAEDAAPEGAAEPDSEASSDAPPETEPLPFAYPLCNSNAECVRRYADQPYMCRPADHNCVKLQSDECPLVYGSAQDFANPQALFVGAYASIDKIDPANSSSFSYALARDELSGPTLGGLLDAAGQAHPLVIITCDSDPAVYDKTPQTLAASMHHLLDDIGVPAVLAYMPDNQLVDAFTHFGAQHGTFFLSPSGATQELVDVTDNGHLWHMLGRPSDVAGAYPALLLRLENYVKQLRSLDHVRVALVSGTDSFSNELGGAVETLLTFNGKPPKDNGPSYRSYVVGSKTLGTSDDIVNDLLEYRPDVVISTTGNSFSATTSGIMYRLETSWGTPIAANDRPFYILSPLNAGATPEIATLIRNLSSTSAATVYRRFLGINVAGPEDPTLYNEYLKRLLPSFPNASRHTENLYDATYFLAYAMTSAGLSRSLTGEAIRVGMTHLLGGTKFGVGPQDIVGVDDALHKNSLVELDGTLGAPRFDTSIGARIDSGSVFCFDSSLRARFDVLRYDANNGVLTGSPCFEGL